VNLLLLLQSRGGMTAAQLARELEVSIRTVHRDVEELSAAGVPIFAERGPLGGIRLVDGYRTRLTGMTAEEAEALFLAGLPGPAAQLGLGTVVAAAQLKVMAALPPELRSRASRIVERFHLDVAGWFHSGDTVPHLATLSAAVWDGRVVRITYERGSESGDRVERTVGPLGLVLKGGMWYVIGATDGQIRTYRASRVLEATVLDGRVERPAGFDLSTYWAESSAAYEQHVPTIDVIVRVPTERRWKIADALGQAALDGAERLEEPDVDGWDRLRLTLTWPDEVPGKLLSIGSSIEVLGPPELRERVAAMAGRILERYRDTVPLEAR
jgi:predicted DNA-binding transcriptional regulator YafY